MTEYVLLGAMAALVMLQMLLLTNSAVSFLALCAGYVLLEASGDNMSLVATSLTSGASFSTIIIRIVLLLVPMLVVIVMLRKQINSAMLPLAFIPAVCTALLAGFFTVPLLPENTALKLVETETWKLLTQYFEAIVGLGLVVSVVLVGLTIRRPHDKKHKKSKH